MPCSKPSAPSSAAPKCRLARAMPSVVFTLLIQIQLRISSWLPQRPFVWSRRKSFPHIPQTYPPRELWSTPYAAYSQSRTGDVCSPHAMWNKSTLNTTRKLEDQTATMKKDNQQHVQADQDSAEARIMHHIPYRTFSSPLLGRTHGIYSYASSHLLRPTQRFWKTDWIDYFYPRKISGHINFCNCFPLLCF